jgi:hypothetical protein
MTDNLIISEKEEGRSIHYLYGTRTFLKWSGICISQENIFFVGNIYCDKAREIKQHDKAKRSKKQSIEICRG